MDKNEDTFTVGKVDLQNPDTAESGGNVTNVQRELNGSASFTGRTVDGAKDEIPAWLDNSVGTSGDNLKERADALTTQVSTNESDIATNASNILNKVDKVNPSTDTAVPRFNGTTGDLQDSGVTIDASNNVIIPGDLTVQGTTTTVESTVVEIADANITLNSGGDQATADSNDAGITIEMSDATDAQIGYDSTLASKFMAGEVGSEEEIITSGHTQTMTDKTFDDHITGQIVTTPATPSAGYMQIYPKSDLYWYQQDENGVERKLGGGTGGAGGGFNLDDDPYAQGGTGDWSEHGDTTDFNGGTFTGLTFSANATYTGILDGAYQGAFQLVYSAADNSGVGVSRDYSIPNAIRNRGYVYITGRYRSNGGFNLGDYELGAYDVTNSELLNIYGLESNGQLPGLPADTAGYFSAKVYIPNDCASLRIALTRQTTDTVGPTFYFSDLHISDSPIVDVPIISDWQDFTPTGSWTTNATYAGQYRRVGDTAEINYKVSLSGAPNATSLTFDMPSGLTPDSNKVTDFSGVFHAGSGIVSDGVFVLYQASVLFQDGSDNFLVRTYDTSGGDTVESNVNATSPITFGSGDGVEVTVRIPVLEWANQSGLVSTNSLMNKNPGFRAKSDSGAALSTTGATFVYEDVEFDDFGAYNNSTGEYTIPVTGRYFVSASISSDTGTYAAGNILKIEIRVNGGAEKIVFYRIENTTTATRSTQASDILELQKGDVVTINAQKSGTAVNAAASSASNVFTIQQVPDLTVYAAYNEPLKTQTKYLTNDWDSTDSNGVSSDLNFSNLTVGKWYKYKLQYRCSGFAADSISFQVLHDSNIIGAELINFGAGEAEKHTFFVEFQATTTTVTLSITSIAATSAVQGNGTKEETFAVLSEIMPQQETTEW